MFNMCLQPMYNILNLVHAHYDKTSTACDKSTALHVHNLCELRNSNMHVNNNILFHDLTLYWGTGSTCVPMPHRFKLPGLTYLNLLGF